jgi:hypothetical protein
MSAIAFENSNVTVRKCSHCRRPGHKINVCREAFIDGNTHHEFLIEIIFAHLNGSYPYFTPSVLENAIETYLRSMTLSQLKLFTYIHTDLNIFSYQLCSQNLISFDQSAMLLKRDIITVLKYYYQTYYKDLLIPTQSKIEIESVHVVPGSETKFQCPICIEEVEDTSRITTNCNHDVCTNCFDNYLSSLENAILAKVPSCCLCRANITTLTFTNIDCCNNIKKYLKCKII